MMNGPSSEIHLRERQKLTSKSGAGPAPPRQRRGMPQRERATTSPRARDASAEQWGCVGTHAAVEKWVWLRKCTYGLWRARRAPASADGGAGGVIPTAPLPQQQLSPTSAAKCPHRPPQPRGGRAVAGKALGRFDLQAEVQRLRYPAWLLPGHLALLHQGCGFWSWGMSAPRCAPGSAFPGALSCVCAPRQHSHAAGR